MQRCLRLIGTFVLVAVVLAAASSCALAAAKLRVMTAPMVRPDLKIRMPHHLVFTPFAPFQSGWAAPPPSIDGVATQAEWGEAPRLNFANGKVRIQNDLLNLYLLLDVTNDTTNDPLQPDTPWGDYFWLVWDVNGDRNITPDVDLLHGIYPGTDNIGLCRFIEPGAVTGLQPSEGMLARGFGPTPGSPAPHRFWEIAIPLLEVGADAAEWAADPLDAHPLRMGFHVHSEVPLISDYVPPDLLQDFTRLTRVLLALSPGLTGVGGPIFATVGVIPSTEITDGYATTDPSYTLYVKDAPFGGSLNLFGHFDGLRARGAKYYQVLARPAGSGAYTPLRLTWSNYRWETNKFVIRQIAPDAQDRYQIPPSAEIWSLRDILVRWPTSGLPDGLWELKLALFDAAKNPLPAPSPGNHLALMLDNTPPHVIVEEITHGPVAVARCAIVDLGPPPDGLRFRITATDYSGHLSHYRLVANWGDNDSQLISADTYASHMTPTKLWHGVTSHVIPPPPAQWRAPESCAYQFRLVAHNRTTNGYSRHIHGRGYNKHITILVGGPPLVPKMAIPPPPTAVPPGLSMAVPGRLLLQPRLAVPVPPRATLRVR